MTFYNRLIIDFDFTKSFCVTVLQNTQYSSIVVVSVIRLKLIDQYLCGRCYRFSYYNRLYTPWESQSATTSSDNEDDGCCTASVHDTAARKRDTLIHTRANRAIRLSWWQITGAAESSGYSNVCSMRFWNMTHLCPLRHWSTAFSIVGLTPRRNNFNSHAAFDFEKLLMLMTLDVVNM